MGTWTRNFLVANANPAEVKQKVVQWLERKGFDLRTQTSLLPPDEEDGRSVFLISNPRWTAVVYSEAFKEGDRLLDVLGTFPTLLEVWIADSDVWGYELYESGELTSAFNSHPGFFGHEELKLPQNGDATRVCRALNLEARVSQVRGAEKRRSLFSDLPCQKFCKAVEAIPGTLRTADLEHWNQGRISERELQGWKIDPLLFEKRRPLGYTEEPPILHDLATRSFRPQEPRGPQIDPEFVKAIQRRIQLLTWIFKPIGFVLAAPFAIGLWLDRLQIWKPKRLRQRNYGLLEAIEDAPKPWHREGDWLVNDRHACRIRVTEEPSGLELPFGAPTEVFRFNISGTNVLCLATPKQQLRHRFDLGAEQTVVHDEKFFIGPHPARLLAVQTDQQDRRTVHYSWLIEHPEVIYEFTVSAGSALSDPLLNTISGVVRTFEFIEMQKS